jgi:hypothetical protein
MLRNKTPMTKTKPDITPPPFHDWPGVSAELGLGKIKPEKAKPSTATNQDYGPFQIEIDGELIEIRVSKEAVTESEVDSVVPEGHRKILKEEGALAWRGNKEFRAFMELASGEGLWTGSTHLLATDYIEIKQSGALLSITKHAYDLLPPERRARSQYFGNGFVAIKSEQQGLYMCSGVQPGASLHVAYAPSK